MVYTILRTSQPLNQYPATTLFVVIKIYVPQFPDGLHEPVQESLFLIALEQQ